MHANPFGHRVPSYLPKGCTWRPLTHAVRTVHAVWRAVQFSTLSGFLINCKQAVGMPTHLAWVGAFAADACIIATPSQIMPPKRVLPIQTNNITQPLRTVPTCHVSGTFSVSTICECTGLTSHRALRRVPGAVGTLFAPASSLHEILRGARVSGTPVARCLGLCHGWWLHLGTPS